MSGTHKKWVKPRPPALINTRKFEPLSTHNISVMSDRKPAVTSNNLRSDTKNSDEGATPHVTSKEVSIKKQMSFGGGAKGESICSQHNNFIDEAVLGHQVLKV